MDRKPYGFRGTLEPKDAFKDLNENLHFDDIEISIKDGVFEVGYEEKDQKDRALKIANSLIASWSKRNNIKIKTNFNQTWELKPDGHKLVAINFQE